MIFNHGKPDEEELINEQMEESLEVFVESWELDRQRELQREELRREEEEEELNKAQEMYEAWKDYNG